MRRFVVLLALGLPLCAKLSAQSCTGLCLQQVQCSGTATSTITGTVYAPNGMDPLPNVTVYIPNAPVDPMTAGVSCPVPGAVPSGSPLVGTTSNTDGTFTLTNVPIGTAIPLVLVSGKWRRQVTIDTSAGSCTNTALTDHDVTRFPRNQTEGDIPKFAVLTGNADPVECVLYKVMGNDSTEFTNPDGMGRINFYLAEGGNGQSGSYIGAVGATPAATTLTGSPASLAKYDVLMLPCEGSDNTKLRQTSNSANGELTNLVTFANSGGRVYASHFSYDWMNELQTFPNVVNWTGSSTNVADQTATVNVGFSDGATLAQWLALPSVGASSAPGQIALQTLRRDFNGVNSPTQSWLSLSNGNVMQFTFDTPVGATTGQCGRVLFNEYHVETSVSSSNARQFPGLCGTSTTMTPQEKLLEYMLFNLTSNGGDPTITPTFADFGSQPLGFPTGAQTFIWTNKSIFGSAVNLLTTTGDYTVGPNNCTAVAAGASCSITVTFTPTVLGARPGTLVVGGGGKTLTVTLTGIGVPALTVSTTSMTFPSIDVTASSTQSFTLTNTASGPVPVPALSATGDYTAAAVNCPSSLSGGSSCTINVTFRPTGTGTRSGSLAFNSAYTSSVLTLTGNGVDFALALSSSSGTVIAGRFITTNLLPTPIAGFSSTVRFSCSTSAPGATCTLGSGALVPASSASVTVTMATTAQYTVIGYGGLGGGGLLILLAGGSVWLLRRKVRAAHPLLKTGLAVLLLGTASLTLTGCGNLKPAQNANYTGPGSYTFTITGTDGILTHTTTYNLAVTVQ